MVISRGLCIHMQNKNSLSRPPRNQQRVSMGLARTTARIHMHEKIAVTKYFPPLSCDARAMKNNETKRGPIVGNEMK